MVHFEYLAISGAERRVFVRLGAGVLAGERQQVGCVRTSESHLLRVVASSTERNSLHMYSQVTT